MLLLLEGVCLLQQRMAAARNRHNATFTCAQCKEAVTINHTAHTCVHGVLTNPESLTTHQQLLSFVFRYRSMFVTAKPTPVETNCINHTM
jgi:hypothetical protein